MSRAVASHFADRAQQSHATLLGMWIFLAGELLLFSGLFTVYATYRARFPDGFRAAAAHTALWLGSANTVLLLIASFLVAGAIEWVRQDRGATAARALLGAALLGVLFLALKGIEYAQHVREGLLPGPYYAFPGLGGQAPRIFFTLYYVMTGLHALHLAAGVVLLLGVTRRARRGAYAEGREAALEAVGLYWHFVDVVWLFLWPAFYLLR